MSPYQVQSLGFQCEVACWMDGGDGDFVTGEKNVLKCLYPSEDCWQKA